MGTVWIDSSGCGAEKDGAVVKVSAGMTSKTSGVNVGAAKVCGVGAAKVCAGTD